MVRRLLVVLLSVSFGFSVLNFARTSEAQTEPGKKTPTQQPAETPAVSPIEKSVKTPVLESPQDPIKKQAPGKTELGKTESGKTESEDKKSDDAKSDEESPKAPSKDKGEIPADSDGKSGETAKTESAILKTDDDDEAAKSDSTPRVRSEFLLPASTKAWISVPDPDALVSQFDMTQIGKLATDPALEPFVGSLRGQINDWVNNQNVRFGIKLTDLEGVHSGEICIAGVFPEPDDGQAKANMHGLVFLMDVSGNDEKAIELQQKIVAELKARGAEQTTIKIHDVDVQKSVIKNPKRFRQSRTNLQVVVNGWMLVSDNESVFRSVLNRLTGAVKDAPVMTLAGQPRFASVMEHASLGEFDAQVRWFVDPFGYIKLVQKLEDESRKDRVAHDDMASKLRDNGFGAIKGIGGNVGIATGEHEFLHRTFVYAPKNSKNKNAKFMFQLFDFDPENARSLEPAKWIPDHCSSYMVANWDFQEALGGFGHFYNGIINEAKDENEEELDDHFESFLNALKVDPNLQLDVRKLVSLMDNQFTVVSTVEHPIDVNSERVAIGIPITGEPDHVFEAILRGSMGREINLGGVRVVKTESESEEEIDPLDTLIFENPEEEDPEAVAAKKEREFKLFKERYFVVIDGYLIVANQKEFIRTIIDKSNSRLKDAPDYIQVKQALAELAVDENVRWRQFGRTDRALEAHYEMVRRGEMAKSQTMIARIMNQLFTKRAAAMADAEGREVDPEIVRQQQIDGSALPSDFAKSIAPFLGPVGWVLETDDDGWRLTGCLLKKKGKTEIVKKIGATEKTSSQR